MAKANKGTEAASQHEKSAAAAHGTVTLTAQLLFHKEEVTHH